MTSPAVKLWWGLLLAAVTGLLWTSPFAIAITQGPTLEANETVAEAPPDAEEIAAPPVTQEGWQIDMANSTIQFEATQYGERFEGKFTNFGGKIIFDPAKLEDAYADIWIDIASIDTGSTDRDGQAKGAEWFDSANFPKALFVADSFSETSPGHYVAHGALTVRGKAAMVDLPFTLSIRESPEGQAALMEGHVDLNRLDFGVGQGQWQVTDAIGGTVRLNITVLATQ
jgi:polyisoprenoid-binding protein YceI